MCSSVGLSPGGVAWRIVELVEYCRFCIGAELQAEVNTECSYNEQNTTTNTACVQLL